MNTTKRIIFTLSFSFLSTGLFQAQARTPVAFGVKAGVNISNISGTYEMGSPTSIAGLHFGGIVDIGISNNFSIVPELLYSMKGAQIKFSGTDNSSGFSYSYSDERKQKLSYFEIPVLAMYKLQSGLHFEAGPYLGILTGAQYDETATVTIAGQAPITQSASISSTEGLNSTDVGFAFGLGFQLVNGLGFSGRYGLGLTDINKTSENSKFTNTNISVSIYYLVVSK